MKYELTQKISLGLATRQPGVRQDLRPLPGIVLVLGLFAEKFLRLVESDILHIG